MVACARSSWVHPRARRRRRIRWPSFLRNGSAAEDTPHRQGRDRIRSTANLPHSTVRKCLHLAGSRGSRLSIGAHAAPSMQRNSFPRVRHTYMPLVHLSVAASQTSLTTSILVSDIVQIVVPALLLRCPRMNRWFREWKALCSQCKDRGSCLDSHHGGGHLFLPCCC